MEGVCSDVYPRYSHSSYTRMLKAGALGVDERPVKRKPSTFERRRKQQELAEWRCRGEQQLRWMRREKCEAERKDWIAHDVCASGLFPV